MSHPLLRAESTDCRETLHSMSIGCANLTIFRASQQAAYKAQISWMRYETFMSSGVYRRVSFYAAGMHRIHVRPKDSAA